MTDNEKHFIDKMLSDTDLTENFKKQYGNLILSDYQVKVLDRANINYHACNSMAELSYMIEDVLNEGCQLDYELEEVSRQIDEYRYYNEIHH